MKKERQSAILKVIAAVDVETQFQLIDELAKVGVESTQATVSRDIKELHLIKELTPRGTYRYAAGAKPDAIGQSLKLKTIFREGVVSFAAAQNIVVVKTLPGLALAATDAIEAMGVSNLVGAIAGDDTTFLAMTDAVTAEKFCRELESMLK